MQPADFLINLNSTEIEGVFAHEMTHVKNYDTRLMAVVAVMVGLVALLGDWFIRMTWFGRRRNERDERRCNIFNFRNYFCNSFSDRW